MDEALKREIWERAQSRCEYCHIPASAYQTPFQIDHVIARKHHGETVSENLALACYRCNMYKGPNIAGIDPETKLTTSLFHPRRDRWSDHFERGASGMMVGRTAVGRTTIAVLDLNEPGVVALRASLAGLGEMVREVD